MNTVEKVARAIYEADQGCAISWADAAPGWHSKYEELARDALVTLREPSEAMVKAGNGALAKVITCRQWTNETRLCVAAAIDAALSEGSGE